MRFLMAFNALPIFPFKFKSRLLTFFVRAVSQYCNKKKYAGKNYSHKPVS